VRCVLFVNEEPPYFQTEDMGSLAYARRSRARGEAIVAMLSLETLGYYSDEPGSQAYPPPFGLLYPKTGRFVGFVGNLGSRGLVRRAVRAFRRSAAFPSEGVAAPGWIMGIGWSDHWAFWETGYPGVMVTDTALFRYPHYHAPTDTPDRIDYGRLARVVDGLHGVVTALATR
jgi:Zn-dependent M28 family amino/carboxypeptidase